MYLMFGWVDVYINILWGYLQTEKCNKKSLTL